MTTFFVLTSGIVVLLLGSQRSIYIGMNCFLRSLVGPGICLESVVFRMSYGGFRRTDTLDQSQKLVQTCTFTSRKGDGIARIQDL